MWWAIDLDDFNGNFCGGEKYPLLSQVYKNLKEKAKEPQVNTMPYFEKLSNLQNFQLILRLLRRRPNHLQQRLHH